MARAEGAAGKAGAEAEAIASHDLENFVTTVTSLLAEGRHTEEDRATLLRIAQRATARMERLIGDLLDNARTAARRPPAASPRAMDVAAVVRGICEDFAVQAARESKIIDFDVVGELPFAQVDGGRLHQVLRDLVGNAMQRTPAGGRVRVVAERAGAEIRLSVTDTVVLADDGAIGVSVPGGGNTSCFTVTLADGNAQALPSDGAAGLG